MIAYFPDASGLKGEFLDQCYHDKPDEAGPGFVQEIRQPWPTGTLLWRLADQMDYLRQSLRRRVFNHETIDQGDWTPRS
jgi:hypothetical protein